MSSPGSTFPRPPIKGRGTHINPANRFDQLEVEPDPDLDQPHPTIQKTRYYKDTAKTVITYNNSPDVGFDASINPYRGCEHGCVYCYARPGHEYFGLSCGLDFESKIFVKTDAAALLRKEMLRPSWQPKVLVMSGVTDPYQPVEKRLKITRQCLETLLAFRNPVAIITKNHLVSRDIDLLEEMRSYRCCAVNISVTSLEKDIWRTLEPRTSVPSRRLKAIEALAKKGIPVRVMLAPVIPGLNDHEIPTILKAAAGAGAVQAGYVMLRLPFAVKDIFVRWLGDHFPNKKNKVLNRLRSLRGGKLYDPAFGERMRGQGEFAGQVRQLFDIHCRKNGLNKRSAPLSTEFFQKNDPAQYTLF